MRGLVITLALLLGAAGCTKGNQETAPGPVDLVRWAQCLREHGITVDDPDSSQPGGGKPRIHDELSTKEQIDAAAEACRAYNPNWGVDLSPDPAETEKLRQFAQCMREHGIDWDDPDPNHQTGAPGEPGPEAGKPTAERRDVLTVPVGALVALAEGGYGVQVVEGSTTRYVAVETGMFAGGKVEVSGEGIAGGVTVGVPS